MGLLRDPLGYFPGLAQYGPVVQVRFGPHTVYVITRPELVRDILVNSHHAFDKGGPFWDTARAAGGNGLANSSAADHRRQRPLLQPAFHPARMPGYTRVVQECTGEALNGWRDGQVIDLRKELERLSATVVTRTLLTSEHCAAAAQRMVEGLPILMRGLYRQMIVPLPWLHRLPLPVNRRFEQALSRLQSDCAQVVAHYRQDATDRGDLLSMIIAGRDDGQTGTGLTDSEARDHILTILAAGSETTASLLAWTFHLLSQHPQCERRLWEEADSALSGRIPGPADMDDLPYTRRVLTEALRVRPPLWVMSRATTADVDVAGARIPAGAAVLFVPLALHQAADVFTNPGVFDPDRWLPERVHRAQREGHFGFGAGPRKCIGDTLAMTEATVILAAVAARYRLRPAGRRAVRAAPRAVLVPASLRMAVETRDSCHPAPGRFTAHENPRLATSPLHAQEPMP
jgi:cytochrome P450